jgi:hypothetical protein
MAPTKVTLPYRKSGTRLAAERRGRRIAGDSERQHERELLQGPEIRWRSRVWVRTNGSSRSGAIG